MEKLLWTVLAVLWTVVWTAAVYAKTTDSVSVQPQAIAVVPIVSLNLAPNHQILPTRVLGEENPTEALGLILGTLLGLRYVSRRRPI